MSATTRGNGVDIFDGIKTSLLNKSKVKSDQMNMATANIQSKHNGWRKRRATKRTRPPQSTMPQSTLRPGFMACRAYWYEIALAHSIPWTNKMKRVVDIRWQATTNTQNDPCVHTQHHTKPQNVISRHKHTHTHTNTCTHTHTTSNFQTHTHLAKQKKKHNINNNTQTDSIAKLKHKHTLFCVKSWNVRLHYTEIPKVQRCFAKNSNAYTHTPSRNRCMCMRTIQRQRKITSWSQNKPKGMRSMHWHPTTGPKKAKSNSIWIP